MSQMSQNVVNSTLRLFAVPVSGTPLLVHVATALTTVFAIIPLVFAIAFLGSGIENKTMMHWEATLAFDTYHRNDTTGVWSTVNYRATNAKYFFRFDDFLVCTDPRQSYLTFYDRDVASGCERHDYDNIWHYNDPFRVLWFATDSYSDLMSRSSQFLSAALSFVVAAVCVQHLLLCTHLGCAVLPRCVKRARSWRLCGVFLLACRVLAFALGAVATVLLVAMMINYRANMLTYLCEDENTHDAVGPCADMTQLGVWSGYSVIKAVNSTSSGVAENFVLTQWDWRPYMVTTVTAFLAFPLGMLVLLLALAADCVGMVVLAGSFIRPPGPNGEKGPSGPQRFLELEERGGPTGDEICETPVHEEYDGGPVTARNPAAAPQHVLVGSLKGDGRPSSILMLDDVDAQMVDDTYFDSGEGEHDIGTY